MGTQKNRLNETVLLSTQNICSNWWIRKKNTHKKLVYLNLCYVRMFRVLRLCIFYSILIMLLRPMKEVVFFNRNRSAYRLYSALYMNVREQWKSWRSCKGVQAYLSKFVARLWEKQFHMRILDCSKYSHIYKCSETTVNSDISVRILFSRLHGNKRHNNYLRRWEFATGAWFTYTRK